MSDPTVSQDAELDLNPSQQNSSEPTAAEGEEVQDITMNEAPPTEGLPESRIPAKKDATLREFISKMDEHAPIIPDAVTNYYLTLAGLPPPPTTPLPLARLLALATQKFIADVAADAYQYSRIRATNSTSSALAGLPGGGAGGVTGPSVPLAGGGGGDKGGGAGLPGQGGDKGKRDQNLGAQRPGYGGGATAAGGSGSGRTVLTLEDLGMAVGEYGVTVRRGEWYR